MIKVSSLLLTCLIFVGGVNSQREFLNPPEQAWTTIGGEVRPGNGLFIDPDSETLVGSFFDGSLIMYNAMTGEQLATFRPNVASGATIRGYGGVTFAYTGDQPYVVYAITENPFGQAQTRVIAVSPSGEQILETATVPGIQAGTPLATYDGRYILINSNEDDVGYFSVFDTTLNAGNPIEPVYQFTANTTAPFAPLGGYLQPAEGYYDGGADNTNDFFAWGETTPENATTAGMGQLYGFQLPMDDSPMSAFALGSTSAFQMATAPVFANDGRSMYLATTRAEQRCWVGVAGFDRFRFNRGRTEQFGLTRGSPQYISARAPPSLGGNMNTPTVYGPGAAAEVWAATYNFSMFVSVPTTDIISGKVQVSPDNMVIYYATQDGTLVQADSSTLAPNWSQSFGAAIEGEIAINRQGTMVYASDTTGAVRAYTVSIGDASTSAPTATAAPTGPTFSPTVSPQPTVTPRPTTLAPTAAPTVVTEAPTAAPNQDGAPSASQPTVDDSAAPRMMSMTAVVALLLGLVL